MASASAGFGDPVVLFQDDRVIAVDKPAGQLVIPGRGDAAGEPLNAAVARITGAPVLTVHRIDREASGVVVFAKDPDTHRDLSRQFELHQVRKLYRVAVLGVLDRDGVISKPIREFGSGRMGVGAGGKDAVTRYRVIAPLTEATLVEAEPETGRRHQLRVHFYSRQHPVLGDPLYGNPRPVGGAARLMLHAFSLAVTVGGAPVVLRAEPPADFAAVLAAYGLRASA